MGNYFNVISWLRSYLASYWKLLPISALSCFIFPIALYVKPYMFLLSSAVFILHFLNLKWCQLFSYPCKSKQCSDTCKAFSPSQTKSAMLMKWVPTQEFKKDLRIRNVNFLESKLVYDLGFIPQIRAWTRWVPWEACPKFHILLGETGFFSSSLEFKALLPCSTYMSISTAHV